MTSMLDLVYRGLRDGPTSWRHFGSRTREIHVDESLDPEVNPEAEGRYYFSIGHEVGHWELHRHHILATSAEPHLLMQSPSPVVCRISDLDVSPQEVVPGQAESADGRVLAEASMRPMP